MELSSHRLTSRPAATSHQNINVSVQAVWLGVGGRWMLVMTDPPVLSIYTAFRELKLIICCLGYSNNKLSAST